MKAISEFFFTSLLNAFGVMLAIAVVWGLSGEKVTADQAVIVCTGTLLFYLARDAADGLREMVKLIRMAKRP